METFNSVRLCEETKLGAFVPKDPSLLDHCQSALGTVAVCSASSVLASLSGGECVVVTVPLRLGRGPPMSPCSGGHVGSGREVLASWGPRLLGLRLCLQPLISITGSVCVLRLLLH